MMYLIVTIQINLWTGERKPT